ncbi:MAG: hypothetical protein Q7S02_04835 [bacterium]|nr:hypothetical protein [bacterium]
MTGITGMKKKVYAERVRELCAGRGVRVETIHLERLMRACDLTGTFREDTMYQRGRDFLQLLCGMTLRDEVRKRVEAAEQAGAHHVILEMHATYSWDHSSFVIASPAHIAQWFRPDLVVTLIDDVHEIYAQLRNRTDTATERFLDDGSPLVDILQWRSNEVTTSEQVARAAHRYDSERDLHLPGFFLFPKALGPELLVQLLCESQYADVKKPKRIVYASFPITRFKGDDLAKVRAREAVDRFRALLKEHFIVLDPYAITEKLLADAAARSSDEPIRILLRDGSTLELPHDLVAPVTSIIDGQIVERDERLIRSADAIVVFLPVHADGRAYWGGGTSFERAVAWLQGKDVIVITESPREQHGPFTRIATAMCTNFDEAIAWFRAHQWIPS